LEFELEGEKGLERGFEGVGEEEPKSWERLKNVRKRGRSVAQQEAVIPMPVSVRDQRATSVVA
jgi:hypothetical protein